MDAEPTAGIPEAAASSLSIRFIGTATTLIECGGFTVLTDPNFLHRGERIHVGFGIRTTRLTDPAMELEELPPLDVVVLSHLHADHFDRVAEERLDRTLPIVTTRHAARYLARKGFAESIGLRTWRAHRFRRGDWTLRLVSLPARHGPPVASRLLPPTMGSLLEFARAGEPAVRVYISGDTLVHDRLREISARHPSIDVGLVHLGGTRVLGLLLTMDARQGVDALRLIRPRLAIPIHYDDYDVFKSPLADFRAEVRAAGLDAGVHYLERGQTFTLVGG